MFMIIINLYHIKKNKKHNKNKKIFNIFINFKINIIKEFLV